MGTILLVLIPFLIIVLVAIAVVIVLLLRRKRKTPREDVPEEQAEILAQGIRETAGSYDGLYEGLYQTVKNPEPLCTDAYQEWCDRAEQCPDPKFRETFAALFQKTDINDAALCLKKHRQLLTLVNKAGILRDRDNDQTCTADESICKYYYEITGQKPQSGNSYQIIKAAWTMDGKVVEYGMVMGVNY